MRKPAKLIATVASVCAILGSLALVPTTASAADGASAVEQGKKLAFDRKLGNCLACHQIKGGSFGGAIAPPLVAMKARFPDKAVLREHIYNQRKFNPSAMMPPFGPNHILTAEQIDKITDYIYTL
ncbi:MAG: sulfur oxidation c-type cytochrome SoxX [Gammaproteobacteria bacterium]|jgi:L-cysteine S-thiosulfotransferase